MTPRPRTSLTRAWRLRPLPFASCPGGHSSRPAHELLAMELRDLTRHRGRFSLAHLEAAETRRRRQRLQACQQVQHHKGFGYTPGATPEEPMPTARPRVMVTLTPELSKALNRVSAGTGQSRSALILDFLEGCLPALQQTADALEAVQKLLPEARANLLERVEQHERLALTLLSAASQNLSLLAPTLASAAATPLPVNKGGTTPPVRFETDPPDPPKVVSIKASKRRQEPSNGR